MAKLKTFTAKDGLSEWDILAFDISKEPVGSREPAGVAIEFGDSGMPG